MTGGNRLKNSTAGGRNQIFSKHLSLQKKAPRIAARGLRLKKTVAVAQKSRVVVSVNARPTHRLWPEPAVK